MGQRACKKIGLRGECKHDSDRERGRARPVTSSTRTEITAAVVDGRRTLRPFSTKRMLSAPKRCYVDALRDECGGISRSLLMDTTGARPAHRFFGSVPGRAFEKMSRRRWVFVLDRCLRPSPARHYRSVVVFLGCSRLWWCIVDWHGNVRPHSPHH
jgi:hypothetical protein